MKGVAALGVVLSVAAFSAVAAGDPADTGSSTSVPRPDGTYEIQVGGEVGFVQGENINFAALGVQGAARVYHFLWARAGLMVGEANPSLIPGCPAGDGGCYVASGSMYQLRAGIEARGCGTPNIVCAFAGVDVADSHAHLMGPAAQNLALVLPRVGLDLGIQHVRLRVAFEYGIDSQGSNAAGLDAGLAYQW
jgi:hypothetical protein